MQLTRRRVILSAVASTSIPMMAIASEAKEEAWDRGVQVLVAGGGAAGCMAALSASKEGAKVLLVHAGALLGGSSAISSGWIRASNTRWHGQRGIQDTPQAYYEDIIQYGKGTRDPEKAKVIADEASTFVNYLIDIGVKFTDEQDKANGGEKVRIVKAEGGGAAIMKRLTEAVNADPNIEVIKQAELQDVILNNTKSEVIGAVVRIRGKDVRVKTGAVVIATGGFGRNQGIVDRYTNSWAKTGRIMDVNAKGKGLEIAADLGAGVANLNIAMVCPTLEVTKNIFYSSAPLLNGGIFVNENGRRFTNEYVIYTTTNLDMLKQKKTWEIVTPELHPVVQNMIAAGVARKCDGYEDLAKVIGCPVEGLKQDIEEHNAITRKAPEDRKDRFGRIVYNKELKAPFYILQVTPVMIETVGGITINSKGQIVSLFWKPVAKGLYGAGAVAFGEHFGVGYRSGEAYAYSGVTGLVAGREAARLTK